MGVHLAAVPIGPVDHIMLAMPMYTCLLESRGLEHRYPKTVIQNARGGPLWAHLPERIRPAKTIVESQKTKAKFLIGHKTALTIALAQLSKIMRQVL